MLPRVLCAGPFGHHPEGDAGRDCLPYLQNTGCSLSWELSPITLLNTDYRLLAKVLSARLSISHAGQDVMTGAFNLPSGTPYWEQHHLPAAAARYLACMQTRPPRPGPFQCRSPSTTTTALWVPMSADTVARLCRDIHPVFMIMAMGSPAMAADSLPPHLSGRGGTTSRYLSERGGEMAADSLPPHLSVRGVTKKRYSLNE